jgi:hypothetical protein
LVNNVKGGGGIENNALGLTGSGFFIHLPDGTVVANKGPEQKENQDQDKPKHKSGYPYWPVGLFERFISHLPNMVYLGCVVNFRL